MAASLVPEVFREKNMMPGRLPLDCDIHEPSKLVFQSLLSQNQAQAYIALISQEVSEIKEDTCRCPVAHTCSCCLLQATMSQVRQVGLLAAGCQPWNKDVCAASGDRFAYCATLAIYIYQLDHRYNEFKLHAIMSEHKKTITAISWCPHNPDLFASGSTDNLVIVWNVAEQKVIAKLDHIKGPDSGVSAHKEAHSFVSDICIFRWNTQKKGKVVFGHMDGSISIFQPGSKHQKHVLRPESLEGTDEEDPVTALEWDPLSTDYLLVANLHHGIRLLDSESLYCITTFSFPTAAVSVQCLAWVPSAPGMFITGVSVRSPNKNHYTSSTSEADPPPNATQNQAVSLPPGHVVCCFLDGGVGLYDMAARKWDFLRELGHVETIFDCKFKPDDPNLLATASYDGTIKVWDINTLTALYTSPGNEGVIFALSWAPGDSDCIAGATSRNGAFIWDVQKGKMIQRFNEHGKNGIFYIAWSHKDSKRIATCSGDGFCIIRTIDGKLLHKYKHPAAVFGCDWSQNNNSIRIWDYTQDACINILNGHTAPVRGLMWNTEIPYLLISGSWDYTIKVWDTRDGVCLDTVYDHGADVYDNAIKQGTPPLLCGKVSRDVKQEAEKLTCNPHVKKLRLFSECLSPPGGSDNLWNLVAVIKGQDDSLLPQNYCKGMMHSKHLVKFKTSEAQELTTIKVSKFGGGIGAPTKEKKLKEAAEIHLRLGQIQRYCELMVELGEWDKALSIAPGVSVKYWRKLMQRRADQLIQEDKDDVIPYCIAIGDVKKLVNFFVSRGQLKEALLVAQAACEGNMQPLHVSPPNGTSCSDDIYKEDFNEILHKVINELAEWYFQDGRAVLAACCHLAVDDIELAMAYLIRGNELELAVSVGTVLGESAAPATHYALQLLARKCMMTPMWNLAADLLLMTPDNEVQLVKLCAFYPGCNEEINDLHKKCNLPPVEECILLAEKAHADGNVFETIKYYLLSQEPEKALPIGIDFVKGCISSSDWSVDTVFPVLDLLSFIRTEKLLLHTCTTQLLKRRVVSVPLKIEHLSEELNAWRACTQSANQSSEESPYTPPSDSQRTIYETLLKRLKEEPLKGIVGPDYVTGSNLPSHSDIHISCLTGLKIQGPVYFLEDGKSTVALNDALMWAKVNPFSPLGTGIRLNPF
ncbi:hypothetical protein ACRRTK_012710 [Alexandromys fortis]